MGRQPAKSRKSGVSFVAAADPEETESESVYERGGDKYKEWADSMGVWMTRKILDYIETKHFDEHTTNVLKKLGVRYMEQLQNKELHHPHQRKSLGSHDEIPKRSTRM